MVSVQLTLASSLTSHPPEHQKRSACRTFTSVLLKTGLVAAGYAAGGPVGAAIGMGSLFLKSAASSKCVQDIFLKRIPHVHVSIDRTDLGFFSKSEVTKVQVDDTKDQPIAHFDKVVLHAPLFSALFRRKSLSVDCVLKPEKSAAVLSYIRCNHPIHVELDTWNPLKLKTINVDPGKFQIKKELLLTTLLLMLQIPGSGDAFEAWAAPFTLEKNGSIITAKRIDLLLSGKHLIVWGKIDLSRAHLDLIVAVPLSGIPFVGPNFMLQIPIIGTVKTLLDNGIEMAATFCALQCVQNDDLIPPPPSSFPWDKKEVEALSEKETSKV